MEQYWASSNLDLVGIPAMCLQDLRAVEHLLTIITIELCSEMYSLHVFGLFTSDLSDIITLNTFRHKITLEYSWLLMLVLDVFIQTGLYVRTEVKKHTFMLLARWLLFKLLHTDVPVLLYILN